MAHTFVDNGLGRFIQQRFEDLVFVGIDCTLDDDLSQTPGRVDNHHVAEPALRIQGKHDPGSPFIGANHLLHADG